MDLSIIENLIKISKTGLEYTRNPTEKENIEILNFLKNVDKGLEFCLCDWHSTHAKLFGKEAAEKALRQQEFEFARVKQAVKLAELPVSERNEKLSVKHHKAVVRTVEDPEKRQEWLAIAAEQNLTPIELSKSARAGKIITKKLLQEECPSRIGYYTPQDIVARFNRWLEQIAEDPPTNWSKAEKMQLVKMFMPIVRLVEHLQKQDLE